MKVLVSAYACEPSMGSEPGVGWNWVKQISRFHEVWVITRANNREVIEEEVKKNPLPNVHFCYFDLPYWLRFYKRGNRGVHLYYYLWQIGIYFLARSLHKKIEFDLVHHVTFVAVWKPTFLSMLPIPFIWGPVGSQNFPRQFMKTFSLRGKTYEYLRDVALFLGLKIDPFVWITIIKAKRIIACNQFTANEAIPEKHRLKVSLLSQIGISHSEYPPIESGMEHNSFSILSVGKLIHLKAFNLAVKAFANLNAKYPEAKLTIIGDGPELQRLRKLARQLHIEDKIDFYGEVSRNEVLKSMLSCDVFLFPSLHDSGGLVVLESMAAGKPVVCLDLGGPGEIVTAECGIKIKPDKPDQVVRDLAAAIETLARDQDLRKRLGEGGRKRIAEVYDWDKKGEEMNRIYEHVMGC